MKKLGTDMGRLRDVRASTVRLSMEEDGVSPFSFLLLHSSFFWFYLRISPSFVLVLVVLLTHRDWRGRCLCRLTTFQSEPTAALSHALCQRENLLRPLTLPANLPFFHLQQRLNRLTPNSRPPRPSKLLRAFTE